MKGFFSKKGNYTYFCPVIIHFIHTKHTSTMKFKTTLTALLIATIGFTGCNKVKNATDVRFDANYTTDLNVNVSPGRDINGSFDESATIDPTSNANVKQYLNVIKSWDIVGISGDMMSVSQDFILQNATVSVSSSDKSARWEFSNISVTTGTTLTLDNSNGQWDTINQILAEKQTFTVNFSGQTDHDNVQFTLRVTLQSKVVANPLP